MRRYGVAAVLVLALATGCSGNGEEPPTAPATGTGASPTAPATTSPPTTSDPTATGTAAAGFDCAAVDQARQDLVDATNAELERLGIDRSDPRAFSVQVLITSQHATEYWTTIREAIPESQEDLRADADAVLDYWRPLNDELDSIEIPAGDEAAIQEATERYLRISQSHPQDDVLPVQERVTTAVDTACATATS